MTEFEVQQLIVGSRYEFDFATLAYMAWALAFIFLSRRSDAPWDKTTYRLATLLYLTGAGFIAIRCLASMLRGLKQNMLLAEMTHQFEVANPAVQYPTLIFRLAIYIVPLIVALHFLRQKKAS